MEPVYRGGVVAEQTQHSGVGADHVAVDRQVELCIAHGLVNRRGAAPDLPGDMTDPPPHVVVEHPQEQLARYGDLGTFALAYYGRWADVGSLGDGGKYPRGCELVA